MTEAGSNPWRWYVAKTRPSAENKACSHLERQGFHVYLPRYLRRISHARRVSWQPRPLFPAYLFVELAPAQQRWRSVNSTIGVSHLICDERGPVPMPPGILEDIRRREDENGLVLTGRKEPFSAGDEVQIMDGPFTDRIASFECMSDEERVVVLLEVLGRQVRTRIKLDAITANA